MTLSTKIGLIIITVCMSLIIFLIVVGGHELVEETSIEKLYKEVTCWRDGGSNVPVAPKKIVRLNYSGMIGNDTFVFNKSRTHNSWSVYFRTDEKVIKYEGYVFDVIEVKPEYVILKLVKK